MSKSEALAKYDKSDISVLDDLDIFPALGDKSLKKLKKVLKTVLPKAGPRMCADLGKCINILAMGGKYRIAQDESGISWHVLQGYKRNYPVFAQIMDMAEGCRESMRQLKRRDALDDRGVDGWEEPVFSRGQIVGYIRKYSDKCLEIALKANDPEKYSDRKASTINLDVAVSFNSVGVDHTIDQSRVVDITGKIEADGTKSGT